MNEWFERWFGAEYLALYPHRDEQDAFAAVALIAKVVRENRVERILDLACGSGRHSRALRDIAWTVGLDLSAELLKVAIAKRHDDPYVRADMRTLPFSDGAFQLVTNLFTSFGYFATDDQHNQVIAEVSRVTAKGGIFVLDYLNAQYVRDTLVPYDESLLGDTLVKQTRSITDDGRYVEKQICLAKTGETFLERVRLFTPSDLQRMLGDNNLQVTQQFGGYDGEAFDDRTSSRIILFAEHQ